MEQTEVIHAAGQPANGNNFHSHHRHPRATAIDVPTRQIKFDSRKWARRTSGIAYQLPSYGGRRRHRPRIPVPGPDGWNDHATLVRILSASKLSRALDVLKLHVGEFSKQRRPIWWKSRTQLILKPSHHYVIRCCRCSIVIVIVRQVSDVSSLFVYDVLYPDRVESDMGVFICISTQYLS